MKPNSSVNVTAPVDGPNGLVWEVTVILPVIKAQPVPPVVGAQLGPDGPNLNVPPGRICVTDSI